MFELKYQCKFDAAHFLPQHKGKCKNLHGHTWTIKVVCKSELLKEGMVIDFGDIKAIINELDHQLLNDFMEVPTAENLAKYLYEKIPCCYSVEVWESDKSSVKYVKNHRDI